MLIVVVRTLRIQTQPLVLATVTIMELKTFFERIIFVHLITLMMKTALYQNKFKKTLNQRELLHTFSSPAITQCL